MNATHDQFDHDLHERLLMRMIDDEATAEERAMFDRAAAERPELRALLERERSALAQLGDGLDHAIQRAVRVELPAVTAAKAAKDEEDAPAPLVMTSRSVFTRRPNAGWWLAGAGWAAVLVMGLLWWASDARVERGDGSDGRIAADRPVVPELTMDDHFAAYLQAPWVEGNREWPPLLLKIDEDDDGTLRLRVMRRVVEEVVLPSDAEMPKADENGELLVSPASLREQHEKN